MPSPSLSVRPVLAALLAILLLLAPAAASSLGHSAHAAGPGSDGAAPAAPPVPAAPAEPAAPSAPAAPPEPAEDSPVSLDLVSLTPASLTPTGTVTAEVEITNVSDRVLETPRLDLRTRTPRVTDRDQLATWQADTAPDLFEEPISETTATTPLTPGESMSLTVQATAEELGYEAAPYYWGTRRISLTVHAGDEPLASLRTFVVWRPAEATQTISQSVLLPLAASDPAGAVASPQAHTRSLQEGRLAALGTLAQRDDVDWWLDPALLDPPAVPDVSETEEAAGTAGSDGESGPEPVRSYAPDAASAQYAQDLVAAVGERTVIGMPYAQADLISLQDAGAGDVAAGLRDVSAQAWESGGITPSALAMPVSGDTADGDRLAAAAEAGATAAVLPLSSIGTGHVSSVTPSSVALYPLEGQEQDLTLLAPDPVLSTEFSLLDGTADTEQITQRMLAETATIASEYATTPRHLLISAEPGVMLDETAAAAVLDAFGQAPWIQAERTAALLDAAAGDTLTVRAQTDGEGMYSVGELTDRQIAPTAPDRLGVWQEQPEVAEAPRIPAETIAELGSTWTRLDTLASVMADDISLEGPRLLTASALSTVWSGSEDAISERAAAASATCADLLGRIEVVPASGYNLISDAAGVPITVTNRLDSAITVTTAVSSDRPLVRFEEQPVVEVPARGQVEFTVPVEAVANGTVDLTVALSTAEGDPVTAPVSVPLTVNPALENWTTMLVVILMGVLVVVGVLRARRTGSSARAPAVHGPEDPEILAATGRSEPALPAPGGSGHDGSAPDDPGHDDAGSDDPADAPDTRPDPTEGDR